MKTKNAFKKLFSSFIQLALITMLLGCFPEKAAEPEKVCKLIYSSEGPENFEYDDKNQLIKVSGTWGSVNYIYDKNGFLTEEKSANGYSKKYLYENKLLKKILDVQGEPRETVYDYNSQKMLTKITYLLRDRTYIENFNNGKKISEITNNNDGTGFQGSQFENGLVVKFVRPDAIFNYYYDVNRRLIRHEKYSNSQLQFYTEFTYRNGQSHKNARPENFFKGFPNETKIIEPDGLVSKATYYERINGNMVKTRENSSTYTLNAKGFATSRTDNSSYRNTSGSWITNSPSRASFSYINCVE